MEYLNLITLKGLRSMLFNARRVEYVNAMFTAYLFAMRRELKMDADTFEKYIEATRNVLVRDFNVPQK